MPSLEAERRSSIEKKTSRGATEYLMLKDDKGWRVREICRLKTGETSINEFFCDRDEGIIACGTGGVSTDGQFEASWEVRQLISDMGKEELDMGGDEILNNAFILWDRAQPKSRSHLLRKFQIKCGSSDIFITHEGMFQGFAGQIEWVTCHRDGNGVSLILDGDREIDLQQHAVDPLFFKGTNSLVEQGLIKGRASRNQSQTLVGWNDGLRLWSNLFRPNDWYRNNGREFHTAVVESRRLLVRRVTSMSIGGDKSIMVLGDPFTLQAKDEITIEPKDIVIELAHDERVGDLVFTPEIRMWVNKGKGTGRLVANGHKRAKYDPNGHYYMERDTINLLPTGEISDHLELPTFGRLAGGDGVYGFRRNMRGQEMEEWKVFLREKMGLDWAWGESSNVLSRRILMGLMGMVRVNPVNKVDPTWNGLRFGADLLRVVRSCANCGVDLTEHRYQQSGLGVYTQVGKPEDLNSCGCGSGKTNIRSEVIVS